MDGSRCGYLFGLGGALLLTACPAADRYTASDLGADVQLICPGDPSGICDQSDDPVLVVGFAAVDISPTEYETWIDVDGDGNYRTAIDEYLDCGMDRLCPEDAGYPGPDEGEADETFQALWLAGFGNSRAMQGAADAIWARATWLQQGETTVGLVSVDLVGWFYNEVLEVRGAARSELDLDHVIVSSTHVHEVPDTLGQWGPNIARSGVNEAFNAQIHAGILAALGQAKASAVPADVHGGSYSIPDSDWEGTGVNNINLDTRDPNITDETIWTARFAAAGTGDTIGTWINFANHPEASGSRNLLLTADFAHTLRQTVEDGAPEGPTGPLPGAGGVAIYFQGACGGMMTPLRVDTIDLDGTVHTESGIEKAYAPGRATGYDALQAIAADEPVAEPKLSFRARDLFIRVENAGFHILMNAGVFDRPGYNYDPDELIGDRNEPDLLTEVSLLEVGDISVITLPGELLPELAIGGYDESHTGPIAPMVDPDNPNPPAIASAPAGPYLKDLMPGRTKMLLGLANDEIGYIVPEYNFILDDGSGAYIDEAPGDHYEETNSVGPMATGVIREKLTALMAWEPPAE